MKLPQLAQSVINSLKAKGFEAYAVGGSVRDTLMGRSTHGWDYTTNATPQQILEIFPDSFYDNQFGTVGIKIYEDDSQKSEVGSQKSEEGTERQVVDIYEITTYRSEQGYTDNRHPDVISWGKTLAEDLSRRDFTINAIATDGETIIDPYEGQKDIENKLIRTVGVAADRFSEDALRMMRAVRIASELGFMIEDETAKAIKENAERLETISKERVRDELLKLLGSLYPADGILLLKGTGILQVVLPELAVAFTIDQKSPKRHHIYDVGTHSVEALRNCPSLDPIVRLATLLHDVGKPRTVRTGDDGIITFFNHEVAGERITKGIAQRLRLSKKQTEKLLTLIRWHQFTVDPDQTDSALRRFIRRVGKDNLEDMLALRVGDRLGGGALETSWRLELFKKRLEEVQKQAFTVADLKINGFDVMQELGVKPGPIVGETLNALFALVEAETLPNEREALLARLRELKLD
jgi:tRNA nucleotidyltransferase (CCA-adding enzyme)